MSPDELRSRVTAALAAGRDVPALRRILVDFAAEGGKCRAAQDVLERMRMAAASAVEEETLLDLLDFATGVCPRPLRIWSDHVYAAR